MTERQREYINRLLQERADLLSRKATPDILNTYTELQGYAAIDELKFLFKVAKDFNR